MSTTEKETRHEIPVKKMKGTIGHNRHLSPENLARHAMEKRVQEIEALLKRIVELEARLAVMDKIADKAHTKAVEADIKCEVVRQMVEHSLYQQSQEQVHATPQDTYMGTQGNTMDPLEEAFYNQNPSTPLPIHIPRDIPDISGMDALKDSAYDTTTNGVAAPEKEAEPNDINNELYKEIMG